jgi:hypothetical protein
MNRKQKVVFLVGVGIIVMMGLIPPWYYHSVFTEEQRIACEINGDYGFLFSPPQPPSDLVRFKAKYTLILIDYSRLLVQWAVVAIATAGIVLVLKDRR